MKFSVVIPTYNRINILKETLPYIVANGFDEIIIVDDASENSLSNKVEVKKNYSSVVYLINETNQGASASRKLGLKEANGDYVIFLDDDIVLPENYLKTLKKVVSSYGSIDCITGDIRNIDSLSDVYCCPNLKNIDKELEFVKTYSSFTMRLSSHKVGKIKSSSLVLFGWNPLVWKRSVLEEEVEFYKYKGNGYREETDPQIQLARLGGKTLYCPNLKSFHYGSMNNGGQWGDGGFKGLRWYISSISNNWKFLRRHYVFLRKEKHLKVNSYSSLIFFAIRNIKVLFR